MKERQTKSRSKAKRRSRGARFGAPEEVSALEAEVALRESEAHYRVPWTASADGLTLDLSPRWTELTGFTREETLGTGWTQSVHPDDLARVSADWSRAVETGEPYDTDLRLRLADGSYRWMRVRAYPRRDKRGRVTQWFGFIEDVHEHHLTVAALNASEERFRLATEALAGFLYDTDLRTGTVQSFIGVEKVLGFDPSKDPGDFEWWQSRVHPEDLPRVAAAWKELLEGEARTYVLEFRIRHKDGHYVDVQDRGRIVRDASGHAIRVVGGSADISEQRLLEREREELLTALQWERSRLQAIFRVSPSFCAVFRGPDYVYEFVNDAYYKMVDHRELLGHSLFDVFPEAREQGFAAVLERVMSEGIPWIGSEVRIEIHPEGGGPPKEHFVDMTFIPMTGPDGSRSELLTHGVDVTAHVLARREIEWLLADSEGLSFQERQSRLAAEKATQARDEMLRVVSHELGGPLTVINIAVNGILASSSSSATAVHENAAILKRAAEWMERLLRDLGDVASIEAGRLTLVPSSEAPEALLTQAVEMFEGAARSSGIELAKNTEPDLPLIVVDSARMLQALGNLVSNALKATKPGGRITLVADRNGDSVRLTVEDTGVGIAPDHLPHVFDRVWQQTHHTNAGLGLGLAIVRGIVEAHGGLLQVASTPGVGSCFSFTIPSGN